MTETILHSLNRQRADILAYVQCASEDPALHAATAGDVTLRSWDSQGRSRETYLLTIKGNDYILTVSKPRSAFATLPRGDTRAISRFEAALNAEGIPVAKQVGHFTLQPQGYLCDIREFVHGYQKKSGFDLNNEELTHLAETLANIHRASEMLGAISPMKERHGLPGGMIHGDYKPDNMIFDSDTKQVKAVLDFELAHYNSFAYELARTTMKLCVKFKLTPEGLDFKFDRELANRFVEAYASARPITRKEADYATRTFHRLVCDRIRVQNEKKSYLSENALEQEIDSMVPQLAAFSVTTITAPTHGASLSV